MKVLKFGGTSVGSAGSFQSVVQIIKQAALSSRLVTVVSAMKGVTDELEQLAQLALNGNRAFINSGIDGLFHKHAAVVQKVVEEGSRDRAYAMLKATLDSLKHLLYGVEMVNDLSDKSLAKIVTTGELLTAKLLELALSGENAVVFIDSSKTIRTEKHFLGGEVVLTETEAAISTLVTKNFSIGVAPGFIASDNNGHITTLGRGGSDYTAALFAAGLGASVLEIWTDVSGIYSADPRLVSTAYPIKVLSFQEVMELSHFGAKVIYPPALYPSFKKGIEILVKNTFQPEATGSRIIHEKPAQKDAKYITGFSSINDITILTLSGSGMVGVIGFSARFFSALAKYQVNVILITQASSEHSICIAIKQSQANKAKEALLEEFKYERLMAMIDEPLIEHDFSIIAIVGEQMNKTKGISGKAFSELGSNGINIHAIAQGASELNISFAIKSSQTKKALNVLHDAFLLSGVKRLHLFIVGIGNIGKKLLELIATQRDYLRKEKHLELVVTGLSNSKKMILQEDLDVNGDWMSYLNEHGEQSDMNGFIHKMKAMDIDHSIFIDNTASEELPLLYPSIFEASIAVVTCNKIAASAHYSFYRKLKDACLVNKTTFLYESNVGAGLPVIRTINHLVSSGDKIQRIEAILSGSLNYIMNAFHSGRSFRAALEGAMAAGLTEPDPRVDLSGKDVARKILILARESGYKLEMEAIDCAVFLPDECMNAASVDQFLELLTKYEDHFQNLKQQALADDGLLRFVASFTPSYTKVGLETVKSSSPFYQVEGKDNIVSISSRWYKEQPLVIKGAGAGAEVTASGIFSDVLSLASK